jgi:glyoxylase-like metal-dependent hydrolase (beta-lactamase superfamily II)
MIRLLGAWLLGAVAALALCACATGGSAAAMPLRLYVLYCGEAQIPDISPWSPGANEGKAMAFSDNCYLIRHGNEWMLWDSGFADALAANPDGQLGARGMRMKRSKMLASQLTELGLAPEQIKHVAFSHTHADHVGNANLFSGATVYMQQAEYDAAFGPEPTKYGFNSALYDKLRKNSVVKLTGDKDVFGDGTVVILSTPGHTPGHQSLLLRLKKTGSIVLSGDLVHFRENFDQRRAPAFNFNREQSLASIDRIAALLKSENAQLWINHDSLQDATLPHAPQSVD